MEDRRSRKASMKFFLLQLVGTVVEAIRTFSTFTRHTPLFQHGLLGAFYSRTNVIQTSASCMCTEVTSCCRFRYDV